MAREADWRKFIQLTAGHPAWSRLVAAAAMFPQPGDALDVGAGGGRDTAHLLRHGWRVTAVDSSPAAVLALRRMPRQRSLSVVQGDIERFDPATYDLVNAQFSLPFVSPRHAARVTRRLRDAVRAGGVITATFFGRRDEWNRPGSGMTFVDEAEVRRLFEGWEIVELTEEERDGQTADGTPKHWHVYHLVARRPG